MVLFFKIIVVKYALLVCTVMEGLCKVLQTVKDEKMWLGNRERKDKHSDFRLVQMVWGYVGVV